MRNGLFIKENAVHLHLVLKTINPMLSTRAEEGEGGPCHPLTWTQRKYHRFRQGAHVGGAKIERDPAELVLTFKTWAPYSLQ